MMQDVGLIQIRANSRPLLSFPADTSEAALVNCSLDRMHSFSNVNALPENQAITFGRQLTLIYGENACGKTGYARALACAAFSRGEHQLLGDLRQAENGKPEASFDISQGGKSDTITSLSGERLPQLAGVYVFDATSSDVHLKVANSLSFSPGGLDLLTSLAEVTDELRDRLRNLIRMKRQPQNFTHLFQGDSSVRNIIAELSSRTDVGLLQRVASFGKNDEERLGELESEIAAAKADNIPARITGLRRDVADLRFLRQHVSASMRAFGIDGEAEVRQRLSELSSARDEAELLGSDQFKSEAFHHVGATPWRNFVTAAKRLADAEASRGTPYPELGEACLLCRQQLSPEAKKLIDRLWEFADSDAPARFVACQRACSQTARQLQEHPLEYFQEDSGARRILEAERAAVAEEVQQFLALCRERLRTYVAALATEQIPPQQAAQSFDFTGIDDVISCREAEISRLEGQDQQAVLGTLEPQLRELQHRKLLSLHVAEVVGWIDSQQWADRAEQALGSTRHITAQYNELFKLLVTDKYRQTFEAILAKLKRQVEVTIATHGQKGETYRQLVLSPGVFQQKAPIERVLSDGEKRAVALADFLTEVSLDLAASVIVLDDPATFLDRDGKDALAALLVEQARTHQVIVFTHDLLLLHRLESRAKEMSVGIQAHWIRREGDEPGYVYLNNSPINEGDYKNAKFAREFCERAKKAEPAEQEHLLQAGFAALRTSYEYFIIYRLFGGVVTRWERVSPDRMKDAILDRSIADKVVAKVAELSRYIGAHLHSDEFASEKPTPENLADAIEVYESLRKTNDPPKQLKAAQAATSAAKAVAQPTSLTKEVGLQKGPEAEGAGLPKDSRVN